MMDPPFSQTDFFPVHFHQYLVEVEQNGGVVGVGVEGVTSEFLHVPLVGAQEVAAAKEVVAMMCPTLPLWVLEA